MRMPPHYRVEILQVLDHPAYDAGRLRKERARYQERHAEPYRIGKERVVRGPRRRRGKGKRAPKDWPDARRPARRKRGAKDKRRDVAGLELWEVGHALLKVEPCNPRGEYQVDAKDYDDDSACGLQRALKSCADPGKDRVEHHAEHRKNERKAKNEIHGVEEDVEARRAL